MRKTPRRLGRSFLVACAIDRVVELNVAAKERGEELPYPDIPSNLREVLGFSGPKGMGWTPHEAVTYILVRRKGFANGDEIRMNLEKLELTPVQVDEELAYLEESGLVRRIDGDVDDFGFCSACRNERCRGGGCTCWGFTDAGEKYVEAAGFALGLPGFGG